MVVDLVGVLEVGGARNDKVPTNPRRTLRLRRGETVTIRLVILRSDGGTPDLSGAQVSMAIRKGTAQPAMTKLGALTQDGATITLLPAETKRLEIGAYTYDIWLVTGSSRDAVVPLSPCIVEPSAVVLS